MSEDVWAKQDTDPDEIEAALRGLMFRRHAENEALIPARVLNLVVIVDREWKGEIANRLERVGRYQASRTVLCAVEEGRNTIDAVATVSYDEPGTGTFGLVREHVEIDLGPDQLDAIETIVDPVLAGDMPTIAWAPHGHGNALRRLLALIDVILLDSDDRPDPVDAFARALELRGQAYVVDLAWLRTTPWRERLAASFDLPQRLAALRRIAKLEVRHQDMSAASGLLLAGWLASRLDWEVAPLAASGPGVLHGTVQREGGDVSVCMRTFDQEAPGLAGVTVTGERGSSLSLQRGSGGLDAEERIFHGPLRQWKILGASRGEAGILGEGVRQALLRDPTYDPALDAARELCPA